MFVRMMVEKHSAKLAKQAEATPTKASPRPNCIQPILDLRAEKGEFTPIGVKFTFY
jgi:hypothetical protein